MLACGVGGGEMFWAHNNDRDSEWLYKDSDPLFWKLLKLWVNYLVELSPCSPTPPFTYYQCVVFHKPQVTCSVTVPVGRAIFGVCQLVRVTVTNSGTTNKNLLLGHHSIIIIIWWILLPQKHWEVMQAWHGRPGSFSGHLSQTIQWFQSKKTLKVASSDSHGVWSWFIIDHYAVLQ